MSSLRNRFDPSSIVEDFVEGPNVEEIAPHKLLDSDQADPKKKADYNESHICLFLGLVLFRIFNAVVMRTYFSPDEFWQGPEVAHRIVFGYGYETWEWRAGLRGYLHPLVYAAPYKLLALCGSDSPLLVRWSPRVVQAVFAAVGDLYLYKLASCLFGSRRGAAWALACNLASWFMLFCITRTNSSCLETSLSTVALYFWNRQPLSAGGRRSTPHGTSWQIWSLSDRQVALWLAGITCVVRPTSAILWLYMGVWEMLQATDKWRFVFMEVLPIGGTCLAMSVLLDSWMYGRWVVAPLNFLRFNLLTSQAHVYGTHVWHWYFSQGFPAMLATLLPLALAGMWCSCKRHLAGLVGWTLALYSCQAHKEFRFVLPVLPLALAYAGHALHLLEIRCRRASTRPGEAEAVAEKSNAKAVEAQQGMAQAGAGGKPPDRAKKTRWTRGFTALVALLLLSQVLPALYFSLLHQGGSVAVMDHLAEEAAAGRVGGGGIGLLMPCHSTPFYSHVHRNIPMHMPDCSPSTEEGHISESDTFLNNPAAFAATWHPFVSPDADAWPSHLAMFDFQEAQLQAFLSVHGYLQKHRFFHAHFPVDRELQASVALYVRNSSCSSPHKHGQAPPL